MNPSAPEPNGKIRLIGAVAGVEACTLVTDQEQFVVGTDLACDLCLVDPLLPGRCFKIYRDWNDVAARGGWVVEALSGTRLYLNNEWVQRDRIRFGDSLHAGCHRFRFEPGPAHERNYRANAQIGDLFSRLLQPAELPLGFSKSRPEYLARRRFYRAMGVGGGLLSLLLLLFLTIPREIRFEQIQPPLEIVMVSTRSISPHPDTVRSLKNVQRRQVPEPTSPVEPPELKSIDAPLLKAEPDPMPRKMAEPEVASAPAPVISSPRVSLGNLQAAPIALKPPSPSEVRRTVSALSRVAPAARRSIAVAEIGSGNLQAVPQPLPVESVSNLFQFARPASVEVARADLAPTAPSVAVEGAPGAARVAALLKYQATPVSFEKYAGSRIPIARLPGALSEVEVPGSDQALTLDGMVSEAEIAMCWKSGQFRRHAPGNPPPVGNPPTYCYVGQTVVEGKAHLYISFICIDPDVSRILANWNGAWGNPPRVTWDDSVEIFLDVNGDRNDYHQLIVNTRGQFWAAYYPTSREDDNPRPWPGVHPRIKTQINAPAQRWTCEIMIPFDELGGTPHKGTRWTVNFCRNFRGQYAPDSNLQNWFLVYKDEQYFLKPNLFGVFEW